MVALWGRLGGTFEHLFPPGNLPTSCNGKEAEEEQLYWPISVALSKLAYLTCPLPLSKTTTFGIFFVLKRSSIVTRLDDILLFLSSSRDPSYQHEAFIVFVCQPTRIFPTVSTSTHSFPTTVFCSSIVSVLRFLTIVQNHLDNTIRRLLSRQRESVFPLRPLPSFKSRLWSSKTPSLQPQYVISHLRRTFPYHGHKH